MGDAAFLSQQCPTPHHYDKSAGMFVYLRLRDLLTGQIVGGISRLLWAHFPSVLGTSMLHALVGQFNKAHNHTLIF